jgi:xanthine dehydrogenase accessory factor
VNDDLFALAVELRQREEPFVMATVVRCERPTSAKPGAKALVRRDGTVVGWIGGACAEPVVVREALAALGDGQPRFIRLVGEGGSGLGPTEGVAEYPMTCHSGGTLEIYVEPFLPKPPLLLIGQGPVVEALAQLATATDFRVEVLASASTDEELAALTLTARTSVVVATHGSFDEIALAWALRGDASYVSVVASRKRAGVIVESLRQRGVPADHIGRLKAPAGLDLGAGTPPEIAVSILAEIIQFRRGQKAAWPDMTSRDVISNAAQAVDPICGMRVEMAKTRYRSSARGREFYFCGLHCKDVFDLDPGRYASSPSR